MTVSEVKSQTASVQLSKEDLVLIHNALNEVCNALDVPEFQTRMGADIEQAQALLARIGELLKTMNRQ
jgi:hypothetical protein